MLVAVATVVASSIVARLCPLSPVFATKWNKTNWFMKKETLFRIWAAEQILWKYSNLKHQNLCHSFSSSFLLISVEPGGGGGSGGLYIAACLCPLSPVFATIWTKTNWFVKKETLFRVWAAEQILWKCRNLKHQNLCHSFSSSFLLISVEPGVGGGVNGGL